MKELVEKICIKIKKLVPEALIPAYAHYGDAGMDVTATSVEYDSKNDCFMYHTGLAFELPVGYVMLIFPRSSNRKTNYYLCNHVGVLDSTYRGELMLAFKCRDKEHYDRTIPPYKVGDRIGQIMILPYPTVYYDVVEELSETDRGEGGFGSTGN